MQWRGQQCPRSGWSTYPRQILPSKSVSGVEPELALPYPPNQAMHLCGHWPGPLASLQLMPLYSSSIIARLYCRSPCRESASYLLSLDLKLSALVADRNNGERLAMVLVVCVWLVLIFFGLSISTNCKHRGGCSRLNILAEPVQNIRVYK
jgi:hypothetical protein